MYEKENNQIESHKIRKIKVNVSDKLADQSILHANWMLTDEIKINLFLFASRNVLHAANVEQCGCRR